MDGIVLWDWDWPGRLQSPGGRGDSTVTADDVLRDMDAMLKEWARLRDTARRRGRDFDDIAEMYNQGSQTLAAGRPLLSASAQASGGADSEPVRSFRAWAASQRPLIERVSYVLDQALSNVQALRSTTSATTFSGTAVTSSIASSMIMFDGESSYRLFVLPEFNRDGVQARIDARLTSLYGDGRVAQRRRGAWDAYKLGEREGRVQACHTMRDIVMHLLEEFAKPDLVMKAAWWKAVDDKRKVTRRDQVRYFVLGDDVSPLDDVELEVLSGQIDQAFETYETACKIAHDRFAIADTSLRGALTALEDSIALLFDQRERIAYDRKLAQGSKTAAPR